MSYPAIGRVLASGLTNGTEVAVLVALAYHLNEKTGLCYPSVSAISRVARRSPNFVRKAIKSLEAKGVISCQQSPGGVRHFTLNLNLLPLPESEPLTNSDPISESQVPPYETLTPPLAKPVGEALRNRKPNKELNRELNKESNKEDSYAAIPPAPAAPKRHAITHVLELDSLPSEWREYCEQVRPDLDAEKVFVDFRFYWRNGRGSDKRFSDKSWTSHWQTWVRKEPEGTRREQPMSYDEMGEQIARELAEEDAKKEEQRRKAYA